MDQLTDWYNYCINNVPLFTIFIYLAILTAFLFSYYIEYKDLFCQFGNPFAKGDCKSGNGAVYIKGKVKPDDSCEEILQKIRISSRYDEESVYWRRSIVFTSIAVFAVLIITQKRLPTGYEALAGFFVIYMLTFLFLNYYQRALSKPATKQVERATKILHQRYCNK